MGTKPSTPLSMSLSSLHDTAIGSVIAAQNIIQIVLNRFIVLFLKLLDGVNQIGVLVIIIRVYKRPAIPTRQEKHPIGVNSILLSGNVCDADIVNAIDAHRLDGDIFYCYLVFLCHRLLAVL
jgi:hypothetical protein